MSGNNINGNDHRQNFRPPTPVAGLQTRLDNLMEEAAKSRKWNTVTHTVIIVFTLMCAAVIWWSVSMRLPLTHRYAAGLQQINRLESRLEKLRLHMSHTSDAHPEENRRTREHALFPDKKSAVFWLTQQINRAEGQGIRLHYELGGIRPALTTHHALDVTLQFRLIRTSAQHSNYTRLMRFVEGMRYRHIPPHINRISIKGTGNGANAMDVQATLWML